jgi:UDP-2-acetamido-3-amino-2,3-dideoxy-glucuronate N-acetyltransferase
MVKIHPNSDIQSKEIGDETVIWQYVIILPGAVIGKNCNINCHVFIENDVIIGDNVTVKSGVQLWDGLRVGNKVLIGPNVCFTNDKYPRSQINYGQFQKTIIEDGASIGAGSVILSDVRIGKYAMIGAGSVVTCNVQPFTLWYGNPARHKGYVTRTGEILDLQLTSKSGKKYRIASNGSNLIPL